MVSEWNASVGNVSLFLYEKKQQILQNPENCIEVMTGAMLPIGTNTVIPYEMFSIEEGTAYINKEYEY